MVLVWDEWYRRGAAKQPITGRMDESKTNQDISVKLNLASPWVYIWQRDLSKRYILVGSSLIHNSSQTKACSGKSWQDIFLGWSEERRANEVTKAKAEFDSRVKWALLHNTLLLQTLAPHKHCGSTLIATPSAPHCLPALASFLVTTTTVLLSTLLTTPSGPHCLPYQH